MVAERKRTNINFAFQLITFNLELFTQQISGLKSVQITDKCEPQMRARHKNVGNNVKSLPLDKIGMVLSMSLAGLGFQLENKLLLLKGKPNNKEKLS